MLFQESALFDSLTIEENVAYPLLNQECIRCPAADVHPRVQEALEFVELGGTLQPTTNQAPAKVLAEAVATLKKDLAQGPFHVKVVSEGERSGATTMGKSPAAAAPAISRPAAPTPGADQFLVEGMMAENPQSQTPSSREVPSTK